MGISPFRTARDIYYDKLGLVTTAEYEGNWVALKMGHLLEDLVAEIFTRKTGLPIFKLERMFQHPIYPFMLADVDFFITLPNGQTAIRPSLPEFQAGVIKVMSPYHVEEEELVLWSLFSAQCLLRHEAQERALELFDRYQHRWGDDRVGGEMPAEHENARCRENQSEKGKTQRKGT